MIRFVRFLVRSLASLSAFILFLLFVIRIFAPGNADTAPVFQVIGLIQPLLDGLAWVLTWPIQQFYQLTSPYLPVDGQRVFPVMSAAIFVQGFIDWVLQWPNTANSALGRQLMDVDYASVFPGVLDWRLLLAIGFWGWVEGCLLKIINVLDVRLYRQHLRHRDASLLRSFQSSGSGSVEDHPSQAEAGKHLLFNHVVNGLKSEISALNQTVNLDPLTQLFNRGYLDIYLDAELSKAKWQNTTLAVLLLDVDNFKSINDAYGHTVGDEVLQKVASVLSTIKPPQGKAVAFRYGGEELVVVLTDTTPAIAQQVGETARVFIQKLKIDAAPEHPVSASLGCCVVRFSPSLQAAEDLKATDLLEKADALMYAAKQAGKNRLVTDVFG